MGRDKALLPFSTFNTLIEYQFSRLSKIFNHVYISAKSADKFPSHLQQYVISDVESETFAPTTGFISMFKHLEGKAFFVISVDTPFIGEDEIEKIISLDSDKFDAVIAQSGDTTHYMCGIYKRSLAPKFEEMLQKESHRLGKLIKESNTEYVYFDNEDTFMNLNYHEEYLEAKNCL